MDKQKAASDIIAAALPFVAFDGWNQSVLKQVATEAGYKKTDVIRVFPGGAADAVESFVRACDQRMQDDMSRYHLDTMKIRERIALAVRLRIETHAEHREALRKTVAFLSLPLYAVQGLQSLYRTVDAMWYAVGDTSTDFSFYTKRLTLAAVYSSTLLYWLDDKSPGNEATWQFLDRRINDVMAIGTIKRQAQQWMDEIRLRATRL